MTAAPVLEFAVLDGGTSLPREERIRAVSVQPDEDYPAPADQWEDRSGPVTHVRFV